MKLPSEHSQCIFRLEDQLDETTDLNEVKESRSELVINGKTKNISKLKDLQVDKLWLYSVNQKEFDTILHMCNPKMLYVYNMKVEDLSIIGTLKDLIVLGLEWNTKSNSLWDISQNISLRSLSIKEFTKLNDITLLQLGNSLEILEISGGDSKDLKLENLLPLSKLINLKYLGLSNIKVKDESLTPISSLKNLQQLSLSNQFPTEEYAKLSINLKDTKCKYFQPYIKLDQRIGDKDVMVVGKRKPFLNSQQDKDKLLKYEKAFKEMQDKYLHS